MGKIIEKTITQKVYISKDGRETPIEHMTDAHLINAFAQACANLPERDYVKSARTPERQLVDALRMEILRRINAAKENV